MDSLILNGKKGEKTIRPPAVAGAFYPSDPEELAGLIDLFLKSAAVAGIEGQLKALIVPHAGYVYSGGVAAYSYRLLSTYSSTDEMRVILVGPSHRLPLVGVTIDGHSHWQTPLGKVSLDTQLRDQLIQESSWFRIDGRASAAEHSLEVQVPFLQQTLGRFKILPLLVNQLSEEALNEISQVMADQMAESTVIIASSDLSHYPAYEAANYVDKKVIDAVLSGEVAELQTTIADLEAEGISNLATCLCGQEAVEIVLKVSELLSANNIRLLKYANSGDVSLGDPAQVVGYAAIAFSRTEHNKLRNELNLEEQRMLLQIVRQTVELSLQGRQVPEFRVDSASLQQKLGVFVTIKKYSRLRGCIGVLASEYPLYQVVSQLALSAAFADCRFLPVEESELGDLDYEISVLSPLQRVKSWQEIEIGKHGVQVKRGGRSGVFLPQVATENNLGLEAFMNTLCVHKAGLPKYCWKDPGTELNIFTVQVFGERI